ncbi:hypothetical protein TNCT_257291 [Trichonephila clavata]|uniref:Uncharacterized protein n=1 Tax=Trichonephila clavata TaxID=2740835 RepID=A0A8X6F1M6_TRICU|nr:hypothetical protein TNCT_257291 [Trichonephila clavata]
MDLMTSVATETENPNEILKSKEYMRIIPLTSCPNNRENELGQDTDNTEEDNSKSTQTDEKDAMFYAKEVGLFALKTVAISGAVLGGVALAVPALGFTAGGVAAGSLAASFQSAFLGGTIVSGSAFAVLQSIGAAGLAVSSQVGVCVASATVSGLHSGWRIFKRESKKIKGSDSKESNGKEDDENAESNKDHDKNMEQVSWKKGTTEEDSMTSFHFR